MKLKKIFYIGANVLKGWAESQSSPSDEGKTDGNVK